MAKFIKGQSGNPLGRPRGARNRTTLAVEALLDGDAERLTRKAIGLALKGDSTALRICMDRIAPAPKDRLLEFGFPRLQSAADLPAAISAILSAAAAGIIRPSEADEMCRLLDHYRRAVEAADLELRLEELERRYAQDR